MSRKTRIGRLEREAPCPAHDVRNDADWLESRETILGVPNDYSSSGSTLAIADDPFALDETHLHLRGYKALGMRAVSPMYRRLYR